MEEKILSIKEIKSAEDTKIQKIYIPEWEGYVVLKGLTQEEVQKLTKSAQIFNETTKQMQFDEDKYNLLFVVYGIMEPEFSEADIMWLKSKSFVTIRKIISYIQTLSCGFKVVDPFSTLETLKDEGPLNEVQPSTEIS